jgi:hypothetical protein
VTWAEQRAKEVVDALDRYLVKRGILGVVSTECAERRGLVAAVYAAIRPPVEYEPGTFSTFGEPTKETP